MRKSTKNIYGIIVMNDNYPNGVNDEDYCILEFQAEYGEYYNNMKKPRITFKDITENTLALNITPFPYN